ncbi:MAG: hypothetical protein HY688_02465, partial [Chloroflexi bacterium]|nr:hypothetical protein [Chloroflexota bacterium]
MTTMGRARSLAGAGLILAGGLLLAGALAFYLFGVYGRSRLGDLVVPAPSGIPSLQELQRDLAPSSPADRGLAATQGSVAAGEDTFAPPPAPSAQGNAPPVPSLGEEKEFTLAPEALAAPRPGTGFDFRTLRAEAVTSASGSVIGSQFRPVDWTALPFSVEALPGATRIQIPAIDLDSRVEELNTKWDGDSLVWETAFYAVGHHHGSPNPGEQGNAVFSGHISSPVSRQGSVFKRLPE